jgi:hypothetical protein
MALKATSLREPRLWESAQKIKAGQGSHAEHAELVNAIKPVRPYDAPVPPASDTEVVDALSKDKKENAFAPRQLQEGSPVAVRLDIPAYEQKNTWVVSVHHPKSDFTAGPVIGYDSVAHIDNPKFGVHPTGALNIASGKPKSTIATVHGNWRNITPDDAYEMAHAVHNDPEWRQVGMDPERHSYFYDRETQQPVVSADEALHIGPLVYAKNPVYDEPEKYKFSSGGTTPQSSLAGGEYIPHEDKRRAQNLKDFHGKTPKEIKEARWYHGTNQDFSEFKPGASGAIFVTQSPAFAGSFSKQHMEHWLAGAEESPEYKDIFGGVKKPDKHVPNIMPVHVRAEKPFDYENRKHINALIQELGPDLIFDPHLKNFVDETRQGDWGAIESPPIQAAIKAMGHDSFYVKETGAKNLAVYDPSQIKSATGNQGTFDPSEADITKAEGGSVDNESLWEDAFHATHMPIDQFDLSKAGTGTTVGGGKSQRAIFLTSDPENAHTYLGGAYVMRDKNPETEPMKHDPRVGRHYITGANILPLKVDTKDFELWDYGGGLYDESHMNELIKDARKRKIPGLQIDNIKDQGYMGLGSGKKTTTYVVLDPSRIRSKFAKFDPAKAKKRDLMASNGGVMDVEDDGITAYHGSPHDFDQFDISKIGTGEGAQVFGHGLYFAQAEPTAREYRDTLTDRASNFRVGNIDMPKWILRGIELAPDRDAAIEKHRQDFTQRLAEAEAEAQGNHQPWLAAGKISAIKDTLAGLDQLQQGAQLPHTRGRMYEVHINAHPDHFLDWDKPLSEQSQYVQDALNQHPKANRLFGNDVVKGELVEPTGQSILNRLLGRAEEKSQQLHDLGIKGIKYLDQGSRGAGEGSRNFVVFDDKLVNVKRKYARGGVVNG